MDIKTFVERHLAFVAHCRQHRVSINCVLYSLLMHQNTIDDMPYLVRCMMNDLLKAKDTCMMFDDNDFVAICLMECGMDEHWLIIHLLWKYGLLYLNVYLSIMADAIPRFGGRFREIGLQMDMMNERMYDDTNYCYRNLKSYRNVNFALNKFRAEERNERMRVYVLAKEVVKEITHHVAKIE